MKQLHLSKSQFCRYVQCPKMLWMHKNMKDMFDDSVMIQVVLVQGSEVGDVAIELFGDFIHGQVKEKFKC